MARTGGLFAAIAAASGAAAVIAGAFGAHGAMGAAADWLRTGAQYQMVHVVAALVAIGWPRGHRAGLAFVAGGWVFAGTLYAMALGGPRWLGAITPIGGGGLILGWVLLAIAVTRRA